MLRALRKKSKEIGLKNLHLKKSADPEFLFPDGCADMAMLGFVLHETARTDRFLSETMRTLRPSGKKAAGPFSGAAEAIERRVPGGKKA